MTLVLVIAWLSASAFAKSGYGLGVLGAVDCPTVFEPASGTIDDGDRESNALGLIEEGRRRLAREVARSDEQARLVARERVVLARRLGAASVEAVERQSTEASPHREKRVREYAKAWARHLESRERIYVLNLELAALEKTRQVEVGRENEGSALEWRRLARKTSRRARARVESPALERLLEAVDPRPRSISYVGNPVRYPARPYVARVRHYYAIYAGEYGGAPGGIGRGAFAGCGGVSGLGLGIGFTSRLIEFVTSSSTHPLDDKFGSVSSEPSGLFNPGFGPGWPPGMERGARRSISAGDARTDRPRFGFRPSTLELEILPWPFLVTNRSLELGFGDRGAGLVDRPEVFHRRGILKVRHYAGGGLFSPLQPGPALRPAHVVEVLPASTLAPPPIIR